MTQPFQIHAIIANDRPHIVELLYIHWGGSLIVSRGRLHDAAALPGFIAWMDGDIIGAVTYRLDGDECEIISLDSLIEHIGIGSALIEAVQAAARAAGCRRVWLITSNDNIRALRFYQKRGFRLVAVHRDAITEARKLKPQIPLRGLDDIPIYDEIELEINLSI